MPIKLGVKSNSVVAQWKNGSVPRSATLQKIADYFDVSTNYLLGETDERRPGAESIELDGESRELVRLFESASPEIRRAALAVLRAADKEKDGECG